MVSNKNIELSLRHLTDPKFGRIPKKQNEMVQRLAAPHIESFNYFVGEGLQRAVKNIHPLEFSLGNGDKIMLLISEVNISRPRLPTEFAEAVDLNIYPKECIERGTSYKGIINVVLKWSCNGRAMPAIERNFGDMPIMVKSNRCHLHNMTPEQLVKHGELVNETGGYFIINGACRVLRLLVANRRNYPIAMVREGWKNRDKSFTDKGIMIRCIKSDESTVANVLHYLSTGMAKFEFVLHKEYFLVPLVMVLKVLEDKTDKEIYHHLVKGRKEDTYFAEKVKVMLRELQEEGLYSQAHCKSYIGNSFRQKLGNVLPPWYSDEEICDFLLNRCVLVHLDSNKNKFETLCLMARKLYAFIGGEYCAESVDVMSMQEVSLGGNTLLQLLKEKLEDLLTSVRIGIRIKENTEGEAFKLTQASMQTFVSKSFRIGEQLLSFISTGNLPSKRGIGLMQQNGLTVVVDHLNRWRDLSHLRALHRGTFFVDMKTLIPRRLTGEGWGFICPVHTPDGVPCGLLNHLAFNTVILTEVLESPLEVLEVLQGLGMILPHVYPIVPLEECYEVVLDGMLGGYVERKQAASLAQKLRCMKALGKIYKFIEIVLVEKRPHGGQYPGLFLFTSQARMMRPVINLSMKTIEYIGTFEQIYLNIAVTPEDIEEGVHSHVELDKTAIFSNIGKLVPFSDCNPNPRNMYQCQMGKQTMGTPLHNWRVQTSNKLYRLQYPQVALVRNAHYDEVNMEEFCMGFNAVVAIVSYTGYDMEDAMVINKCSMERGLGHGQVYKTEFIDLTPTSRGFKNEIVSQFKRDPKNEKLLAFLDESGLPYPGTRLTTGDPYYCTYNLRQHHYKVVPYRGEDCVVDKYTIMSKSFELGECQRVSITLRVSRYPIIGDKFASRSGQKGIMSCLYPTEDLPFSESGIVPDIIFNPHGIPSRMTAGKLLELIAGKAAAEFGKSFNSTPFEFDDENPAFDFFGKILEKGGFNYYGEDILYSGTDGRMMNVNIYEGIVYYQRLRHMTADKWQVRATGPVDVVTRQPVKGRKRGGAIRFGEMERDCLISHGAAYTLKDRMLDCSDDMMEWVCESCGGLLSVVIRANTGSRKTYGKLPECGVCGSQAPIRKLHLPYAFKYLVAELASVGIDTKLKIERAEEVVLKSTQRESGPEEFVVASVEEPGSEEDEEEKEGKKEVEKKTEEKVQVKEEEEEEDTDYSPRLVIDENEDEMDVE
ncbi:RNA polymerase I subunit Rpl135 [Oratosquilla oratoria]|uniref:RNA polymerase I subunit Rpl135 n=1 Tax=Oratosquilla oratoria TaxID=337810 RepID=UPI003F776DFA